MIPQSEKESALTIAREVPAKIRKFTIYGLLGAIGFSSIIVREDLRVSIYAALTIALMFFLFDIFASLTKRLDLIDKKLPDLESSPYPEFSYIVGDLDKVLDRKSQKKDIIHVEIIAVSAHCTWPYFQKRLTDALEHSRGKIRLKVDIMISSDETLLRWNVPDWKDRKTGVLAQYNTFMKNHGKELKKAEAEVNIYFHDNIPHWHGVLIDREILFLGRTEWKKAEETGFWELKVGQVEYRRFHKNDDFGGLPRILRYGYWADRYRDRHNELKGKVEPDSGANTG